jgi:hypothetical protein
MGSLLEASQRGDAAVIDALYEIEGVADAGKPARGAGRRPEFICQSTDRAWELIHRALIQRPT